MKRIEKIKGMDAARLAEFLVEHGAEVPTEFCDYLCFGQSCAGCPYTGEDGDSFYPEDYQSLDDLVADMTTEILSATPEA